MLQRRPETGEIGLCAMPGGHSAPLVAAERYGFKTMDIEQGLRGGLVRRAAARILVADDEPAIRGFLRKLLESAGYEVVEASDGKQVLLRVRTEHVGLVITDLVMPEKEGIETIQALRREFPGVGIIAISGAFEGECLGAARMLGAHAVLNKPVNIDLLLDRVAELLKSQ